MKGGIIVLMTVFAINAFTIQRSKKQEEQSQPSRFRQFIRGEAVPHLPQFNRIPSVSKSKSLVVPPNTEFNPCSTSNNICFNDGKCVNRDGMFTCHCPATHYGKRCEKLADMKNCFNNKCKNNSVCVSRPFPKEVVDRSEQPAIKAKDKESFTMKLDYDCICLEGFLGSFCETSDAELECKENYCMSHGTGTLQGNNCTCNCHSNYIGSRCETENPCASITCYNSGKCELKINEEQGIVEAVCKCPKTELISTQITGDFCEIISLDDTLATSPGVPCMNNGSRKLYAEYMVPRLTGFEDRKFFSSLFLQCTTESGENCRFHPKLSTGWCIGKNALCNPRVVKFPSGYYYLVPFCQCDGADYGRLCEFHREDVCDPTMNDKANGITRENRCTNIDQGVCIDILGDLKCDCRKGFVGEECETYNPCVSNPCGEAECVAIPSEVVVNRPGLYKELYRCLCDMNSERSEGSTCVYSGTGNCSSHDRCHNGMCLTCEVTDENDVLQLCTEQQLNDGFRCVCKPGFQPPYCQDLQDPCFTHLCANGGRCRKTSKYDYECICNPGTNGTLCEQVYDYCLTYGIMQCMNGECVEDISSLRGFSCACDYSYYGKNCELKMESVVAMLDLTLKYYWFTLPILSIFITCVIFFVAYMCCSTTSPDKRVIKSLTKQK
ncbi:unnamed protein product [Auanema sp. JU1783]|nr:unnamed protein product [Auanema sp. JU1783]